MQTTLSDTTWGVVVVGHQRRKAKDGMKDLEALALESPLLVLTMCARGDLSHIYGCHECGWGRASF